MYYTNRVMLITIIHDFVDKAFNNNKNHSDNIKIIIIITWIVIEVNNSFSFLFCSVIGKGEKKVDDDDDNFKKGVNK